jgi:hydrogenase maturation protein HypF
MSIQSEAGHRLRLVVRGAVQGVGFRPFVYRLATAHDLAGWIQNDVHGACIEVEGAARNVNAFLERFRRDAPCVGLIQDIESTTLHAIGETAFEIRDSDAAGVRTAWIMADLATCRKCCDELFDPSDRRFRYPFLNCTQCGPRFSIIERLPYDRPNTTMRHFRLCAECQREYDDPTNRRFHAQPIACPRCGPRLELWDESGKAVARGDAALLRVGAMIREGAIVAVKGLGGFQLLVDARNEDAVQRLRVRKGREEKPFALMVPSLAAAAHEAELSVEEGRLLESRAAPIVLLRRRNSTPIAAAVAPGNPCLGMMLPYTPLHHLIVRDLGFPVVATSGNRTDEPIAIDESDAIIRLAGIADLFLTHDRPIARPMDDSVARVVLGREQVLRRARGYAPLPITLPRKMPTILAVGGHLKNTVALAVGRDAFLSQHVGDLESSVAAAVFEQATSDLPRLYGVVPEVIACDGHPDYRSTRFAEQQELPIVRVQHHAAHVLACMAEHGIDGPVTGVAWDGTGWGTDGTIWGGEFLHVADGEIRRVAHLRPFPLPGGDNAVREPRRAGLGLLYAWLGDQLFARADIPLLAAFTDPELEVLAVALRRGINAPLTTSVGRLFDAVAALAAIRHYNRHEGQAAMEWEWRAERTDLAVRGYEFPISGQGVIDWRPMLERLCADLQDKIELEVVSSRFHAGLIKAIVAVCRRVGEPRVVLSGGCFLNRNLLEGAVKGLTAEGFAPYWHQRIPTGDGGIALGQVVAAANEWEKSHVSGSPRQADRCL